MEKEATDQNQGLGAISLGNWAVSDWFLYQGIWERPSQCHQSSTHALQMVAVWTHVWDLAGKTWMVSQLWVGTLPPTPNL